MFKQPGSERAAAIRHVAAEEPDRPFPRQRRDAGRRSPRAIASERGDFASGAYEARLRRNPNRIQVQLSRQGNAWGSPLKITKGLTLEAGSSTIEIAYLIEGLEPEQAFHFSVEFNFAGLPSGCDDRYFHDGDGHRLGHLGRTAGPARNARR